MTRVAYSISTPAVALAAATAKTIAGLAIGGGGPCPNLLSFTVSFDGVTASAVPVLVELCNTTWASNFPGTNSTAATINQTGGQVLTSGVSAGHSWTVEPTVVTPVLEYLLTPNGGVIRQWWREGLDYGGAGSGWTLRCTAPAIVNVRASMSFHRL